MLRTTYEVDDGGGFAQRVRAALDDEQLLRQLTAADGEAAEALVAADASTGFDLLGGGVLRCVLVRVDEPGERQLLLINVHHVAFDGASANVLLGELGTLYRTLRSGGMARDAPLPELSVQYVDFALWQRSALADALDAHRDHWRAHLREGALPVLELPTDFPRPATQTFSGDAVPVAVPADVTVQLERLARSHGATLFQLVLALWALLLCRHAGQDKVVVGSPYHGRDAPGTESLIGYFVNTLALRLEVPRGGSAASVLRGARDA